MARPFEAGRRLEELGKGQCGAGHTSVMPSCGSIVAVPASAGSIMPASENREAAGRGAASPHICSCPRQRDARERIPGAWLTTT